MPYQWSYCFSQIYQKYCNTTGLHCWKYLIEKERTFLERLLWCMIQITASLSAIYLFYIICGNFWSVPTVTTLDNTDYHIRHVPFPAVAICDINRISLKKATEYAKERAPLYNISWETMLRYTKYFGRLYDYDEENIEIINEFNALMDSNKDNIQFDYTSFLDILIRLTPSFSENIIECIWKTKVINCSHIFNFRRTQDGFCSTFNYKKSQEHVFVKIPEDPDKPKLDTRFLDSPGEDMGLTILVRSNVEDYYYPLSQMEGLKVFLFNSRDYPDTSSGGLVESLVPLGHEVFLKIDPETVEAVDILRNYKVNQRRCFFSDEGNTAFDSYHYSNSDCLIECKMKSILALCECVPFYYSISDKLSYSKQLCTIADIPCLNHYKEKWNTLFPASHGQQYKKDLAAEFQNSVECSHCLPDCSFTKYRVINEYSSLSNTNNPSMKGYNISEISLVHIYFDTESTFLYKTDLLYYWFDIISNFGGMCGVFMGFGIISIIEVLYHFLFLYIVLLIKTKQKQKCKIINITAK